jgi:hypothetical protein
MDGLNQGPPGGFTIMLAIFGTMIALVGGSTLYNYISDRSTTTNTSIPDPDPVITSSTEQPLPYGGKKSKKNKNGKNSKRSKKK